MLSFVASSVTTPAASPLSANACIAGATASNELADCPDTAGGSHTSASRRATTRCDICARTIADGSRLQGSAKASTFAPDVIATNWRRLAVYVMGEDFHVSCV